MRNIARSPLLTFMLILVAAISTVQAQSPKHTFALGGRDFLLDGKPFQIIAGEMHFARIPREYWRQRLKMARAMGLNTIATYVFWNYHEPAQGHFDFKSESRNIADGPGQVKNACVPDVLPAINGENNAQTIRDTVNRWNNGKGPYLSPEFYPGWLDHWGERHSLTPVEEFIGKYDTLLSEGISVSP